MRMWRKVVIMAVCLGVSAGIAVGQQKKEKLSNPVHLELTAEVAATTEEGYPSVLRIMVKNVGNVAVDMPMPVPGCLPRGGHLFIQLNWQSEDPKDHDGKGWGEGCGEGDMPGLVDRLRDNGICLRPGEFITSSYNLHERLGKLDPGTVEYWIEYVPPRASPKELAELQQSGYIISTEKIETAHQTFVVH